MVALENGWTRLRRIDCTETDLCDYLKDIYRHLWRNTPHPALAGIEAKDFPVGAALVETRFSRWRSKPIRIAKVKENPSPDVEPEPAPFEGIEEAIRIYESKVGRR